MESLLAESRIPEMAGCGLKVSKVLYYFKSIGLNPTINIQHNLIHEICEKVFRHINYKKETIDMDLFPTKVFLLRNSLRFCLKKIAHRYYI